jgi:hypothetical protein
MKHIFYAAAFRQGEAEEPISGVAARTRFPKWSYGLLRPSGLASIHQGNVLAQDGKIFHS